MGDGVTGSVNAPASQPANAGRGGAPSRDTAAHAEFGKALEQERLCPPGLGRPPAPCTYLRHPSHGVDLQLREDSGRFKGPTNSSDGPDYSKPIAQLPSNSPKVPEGPTHTGGLGSGDGAHIFGWEWKR